MRRSSEKVSKDGRGWRDVLGFSLYILEAEERHGGGGGGGGGSDDISYKL